MAVSADGQRIVSGGEDAMVRIWDAASGQAMYAVAAMGARCGSGIQRGPALDGFGIGG